MRGVVDCAECVPTRESVSVNRVYILLNRNTYVALSSQLDTPQILYRRVAVHVKAPRLAHSSSLIPAMLFRETSALPPHPRPVR